MPARGVLREFWPELLCGGLLVLIAFAGGKDDGLFAVFTGILLAIGWSLGYRHRSLSLHKKVDRMTDGVGEMLSEMRRGSEEPEQPLAPVLHLVRGKSAS